MGQDRLNFLSAEPHMLLEVAVPVRIRHIIPRKYKSVQGFDLLNSARDVSESGLETII